MRSQDIIRKTSQSVTRNSQPELMKEELYIQLLQKELAGNLSASEKKSLDEWLSKSPDNQLIAKSIRRAWNLSDGYSKDIDLDLDSEFTRLEKRMDSSEVKVVKMRPARNWMRIAASVLILVFAGVGISRLFTDTTVWMAKNTIDGERIELNLPDGSKIALNENSKLEYPEQFSENERRVKLTGEAFFEVEHNPKHPFIIEGTNGETRVLGTSFNVRNYNSEEKTVVTVRDGKVRFSPKNYDENVILIANEKGVFDKKAGSLKKSKADRLIEIAWHTRTFKFKDTPVLQALNEIGLVYQIELEIGENDLENCRITADYIDEKLNAIFKYLNTSYGIEFEEITPKKFITRGGKCD